MKVICIEGAKIGDNTWLGIPVRPDQMIYEGEVYTVLSEVNHPYGPAYFLAEKPADLTYQKRRFIPLSDISETEMKREYNVQPA